MNSLRHLCSDEFLDLYGYIATPSALRRALQRSPEVRAIRDGLASGAITEMMIRGFTDELLGHLHRGGPLEFDSSIAAVAIALEECVSPFAGEFLSDLAKLELTEMKMSIRVARECLVAQKAVPRTIFTEADLGNNVEHLGSASKRSQPP